MSKSLHTLHSEYNIVPREPNIVIRVILHTVLDNGVPFVECFSLYVHCVTRLITTYFVQEDRCR